MSTIPILRNQNIQLNARENKVLETRCRNQIIDYQTETRIILDLIAKSNSPNDIKEHFWNVFKIRRKYYAIRKVISKNVKRAQRINSFFDVWACHTLMLLEIDETLKGRHVSLLVVADSLTGYIFLITWIPNRTKDTLIAALSPLKELFQNVTLVLTDGAVYFPEVISEIFPNAKHQRCLIHILRNLYPFLQPIRQSYSNSIDKLHKNRQTLTDFLAIHKQRLQNLDALNKKLKYWQKKRTQTQENLGIKQYQKNINRDYPELKYIYEKINLIRASLRSLKNTIHNDRIHIKLLEGDVIQAVDIKNQAWGLYMKYIHVLYDFYNLFQKSPKKFEAAKEKYITKTVNNPATDLTKAILKVLTDVKEISTVYLDDCQIRLNRNFLNTNLIESINSRIRPILDKLKKIQNTFYLHAILEIVKLRLNTKRPYSGPRVNQSPIERCGYDLKSRTWIDLILNGLPPGSQQEKNLRPINNTIKSSNPYLTAKLFQYSEKESI